MNKWFERAILINLILLIAYIFIDYLLWVSIAPMLQPIYSSGLEGVRVRGDYTFISRMLTIGGHVRTDTSFEGFDSTSSTPNFPLLLFIVAMLINLILIYKAAKPS